MNTFEFTTAHLESAIRLHSIYFEEFYQSGVATAHLKRNLQRLGVIFTGSKMRVSKQFYPIVENYMEAKTVHSNGKRAYIIFGMTINPKGEVLPIAYLLFEATTNRETMYVSYGHGAQASDRGQPRDEYHRRLVGIRGHAVARYKERKNDLTLHDTLKELFRLVHSSHFNDEVLAYRRAAMDTKLKQNMVYISGEDELRLDVDMLVNKGDEGVDRGLMVIIHTYINRNKKDNED